MATGITARDKKLLYMLGLIVIAALFFIIGIRPLNKKISKTNDKLDDAQVLHDSIKMKIYQLDMITEFKDNSVKMADELSSRYYEHKVAADVDKLITNQALSYGLKVNNFSVQSPKEPVDLVAYQYSEAWAAKQRALEASAYLEESVEEETATTEDGESDKKKDKDSDKASDSTEVEGMVDIETLASINNDEGMYNLEGTTQADVYAASIMLDVYGNKDKAQALLNEIISNKAFRVTSYEWSDLTSSPFEYVDGELVQVAQEGGSRLVVNFEMYMYDGAEFKAIKEGNSESVDGSQDESQDESQDDSKVESQ